MGDTRNGKLGEAVGVSGRTEGGEEAQAAPFFILVSFYARPEPASPPSQAHLHLP